MKPPMVAKAASPAHAATTATDSATFRTSAPTGGILGQTSRW